MIQNMLKFIDSKKESWEDYLETCTTAYNSAKHKSSKFSQFKVMFRWRTVLPVDLDGARACEDKLLVMENFNKKRRWRRRARLR